MRAHEGRRETNLALLLRTLRVRGALSRAQLAAASGLSKAAVSPLLAELEQRGPTERAGTTTTQGRPGQPVQPRPGAVCGIGLDVHPGHPGATITDLTGEIHVRMQTGCDTSAPDALHRTAAALTSGISILAGLLNPQKIVLGGYFAALHDWLVAPQAQRTPVTASPLGFTAGAKGAALAALSRVLDDPTVVPVRTGAHKEDSAEEGASA